MNNPASSPMKLETSPSPSKALVIVETIKEGINDVSIELEIDSPLKGIEDEEV